MHNIVYDGHAPYAVERRIYETVRLRKNLRYFVHGRVILLILIF